jgi:hypothetical protein
MAMVSPSQPRPAVIQRTSISAIDEDPVLFFCKGRLAVASPAHAGLQEKNQLRCSGGQFPDAFYPVSAWTARCVMISVIRKGLHAGAERELLLRDSPCTLPAWLLTLFPALTSV